MTIRLLDDAAARERLSQFIRSASAARSVALTKVEPLRGGAIQENWAVDAELDGGSKAGRHELVLRADAATRVAASHGRTQEFALLCAAHGAGVTVPEPLWLCADRRVLGRDFYLMRRLPGIAAGHKIVRDPGLGGPREALLIRLAGELARIHRITPQTIAGFAPDHSFEFLSSPTASPAPDRVATYRRYLDEMTAKRPALEWGLRWIELNPPSSRDITLVHQDFRTGNYLVDETGLTAILDWEFCAWGDPMADIGWFCAKCWRFGANDKEAGGISSRKLFYDAYEKASGRKVDPASVRAWETMAHLRWAVIALQQCARHLTGGEASLELALTGRLVPELELEILNLVDAAETAGRVP
ncbi:MAG: phosphotransferase family protein [Dongiaceae bacterium]